MRLANTLEGVSLVRFQHPIRLLFTWAIIPSYCYCISLGGYDYHHVRL